MTDRRSRPRASLLGKAMLVSARHRDPVELNIRDLSVSGARLIGRTQLLEGEQVRVTLELDGRVVAVPAHVTRTEPQSAQIAVAFDALPAETLAVIEAAVTALLERVRAEARPSVVVLSAVAEIREALERDLAQLGLVALGGDTLESATRPLQDVEIRCEAVIVESAASGEPLGPILQLLAKDYPRIRRVVLFGDKVEPLDHASSSCVDAVLRRPLRIRALARALGIRDTDSSVALLPQTE